MRHVRLFSAAVLATWAALVGCGEGVPPAWRPAHPRADIPYVQEVATFLEGLADVRALAVGPGGELVAATPSGVARLVGGAWAPISAPLAGSIEAVAFDARGRLGIVSTDGFAVDGVAVALPSGVHPRFLRPRRAGGFWLGGAGLAAAWDGALEILRETSSSTVVDLVDAPGGWLLATPDHLLDAAGSEVPAAALLGAELRALARDEASGTTWVGTAAGLLRRADGDAAWTPFLGAEGLHFGDVARLSTDSEGALWVATSMGASVYRPDGGRRYYLGRTWLPSDEVRSAARLPDGGVAFATAAGVARIDRLPMTLAERARRYDLLTAERHVRLGLTSTENHLREAGKVETFFLTDDDNDGEWTGMYLASQCFRFAATGDDEARRSAEVAADALLTLESITPRPGFFARSILSRDDCGDPAARGGEWHVSEDGRWCWKGDTSVDELVGHTFGLSIYYDLVADEPARERVRRSFTRLVDAVIDGGFTIRDVDGEVTTDGHLDPVWMHEDLTAIFGDAGLDSAIMLGALATAHHMSGDAKYRDAFEHLARAEGYADFVSRIEEINLAVQTNHDSEEMSFLALYPLIRYETDRELATAWRRGLVGLWTVQRPERDPELDLLYGALAEADDPDLDAAIETLQKLPLDLVLWNLDLSKRWDRHESELRGRHGERQDERVFPYDERRAMRWSENPYAYELRGDGRSEASGTFWLLPYWMVRYYGFIR